MSVSDIRTFSSIMGRKETKYVIWEPIYELCIICELYKENTKSNVLLNIYCMQWIIWSVKLPLMDLLMKYLECEVYSIKNGENWATQVQVMPSWTFMYLSWPLTFVIHFKVYRTCVLGHSSVSNVILNMTTPLLIVNLYQ